MNESEAKESDFDYQTDSLFLETLFGDRAPERIVRSKEIKDVLLPSLNIPVRETRTGRVTSKPKHLVDYTS